MNDQMIDKYFYLMNRFDKSNDLEYDAALDGLIRACGSSTIPENPEAFIYESMKNRVKNQKRDAKRQKEPTTMPQNEAQKVFTATIPAKDSRQPKKFKGDFHQFYAKWLGEHNTTDSTRNRVSAEEDWDILKVAKTQPVVISLEDPLYDGGTSGDPDLRTQQDVLASDEKPIDDLMIEEEEIQAMACLDGIQDEHLRNVIRPFLPTDIDATKYDYELAYQKALARIMVAGDWRKKYSDAAIRQACNLSGTSYDRFVSISPSRFKTQVEQQFGAQ